MKVGVVGEIYVKYSPLGNNDLEKFLASQDCEVNLPGLMGFVQYCVYNLSETARLYGGNFLTLHISAFLLSLIEKLENVMRYSLMNNGFHAPMPFRELIKQTEGIISHGDKMGEGWLLTAEMVELVRSGYENIVCAQPFGCLPNHICGKGVINRIRSLYPQANITPIDYDPGATRVNQENRIKLMLAVARERLEERENASKPREVKKPELSEARINEYGQRPGILDSGARFLGGVEESAYIEYNRIGSDLDGDVDNGEDAADLDVVHEPVAALHGHGNGAGSVGDHAGHVERRADDEDDGGGVVAKGLEHDDGDGAEDGDEARRLTLRSRLAPW